MQIIRFSSKTQPVMMYSYSVPTTIPLHIWPVSVLVTASVWYTSISAHIQRFKMLAGPTSIQQYGLIGAFKRPISIFQKSYIHLMLLHCQILKAVVCYADLIRLWQSFIFSAWCNYLRLEQFVPTDITDVHNGCGHWKTTFIMYPQDCANIWCIDMGL